jgi:hypothetical protein
VQAPLCERLAPGGAESCSQGREPLDARRSSERKPQRGDIDFLPRTDVAPPGLADEDAEIRQGLAPLATRLRPSGASMHWHHPGKSINA